MVVAVFFAGNKQKLSFPYDIVCDFNRHTCGFKNGGSAVWNWRTVNTTGKFQTHELALGLFIEVTVLSLNPIPDNRVLS